MMAEWVMEAWTDGWMRNGWMMDGRMPDRPGDVALSPLHPSEALFTYWNKASPSELMDFFSLLE